MRIVFEFKGKKISIPITNEEFQSYLNGTNDFWGYFLFNGVKYQMQLNNVVKSHNYCSVMIFLNQTNETNNRIIAVKGEIIYENEIHDLYLYPVLFHELSEMFLTERIPIEICVLCYNTTSSDEVKMNAKLDMTKFIAEHLKPVIGFSVSMPVIEAIENIIQSSANEGNIHLIHESYSMVHAFLIYKKCFSNGSYEIFKECFISCGWESMDNVKHEMVNDMKPSYVLIDDCLFDMEKLMNRLNK